MATTERSVSCCGVPGPGDLQRVTVSATESPRGQRLRRSQVGRMRRLPNGVFFLQMQRVHMHHDNALQSAAARGLHIWGHPQDDEQVSLEVSQVRI